MKSILTKYLSLLALAFICLPMLVQAAPTTSTSTKPDWRQKDRAPIEKIKDTRSEMKTVRAEIKGILVKKMIGYYNGMENKITNAIERMNRYINRLSGPSSILEKLKADGKNVDAVSAKLDEAKVLVNKARTDLEVAMANADKIMIPASSNATGTIATTTNKALFVKSRDGFKLAINDLRAAQQKIKEAIRLIKEIPGVRKVPNATTTATSTN